MRILDLEIRYHNHIQDLIIYVNKKDYKNFKSNVLITDDIKDSKFITYSQFRLGDIIFLKEFKE